MAARPQVGSRGDREGRAYTATSRMAPANDIARQLVADGVPDAPMQVYTAGLKGCAMRRLGDGRQEAHAPRDEAEP